MIRNIKRALAIFLALLLAAPTVALADDAAQPDDIVIEQADESAQPSEEIDARVDAVDGLELDTYDDAHEAPAPAIDDAAAASTDPVTPPTEISDGSPVDASEGASDGAADEIDAGETPDEGPAQTAEDTSGDGAADVIDADETADVVYAELDAADDADEPEVYEEIELDLDDALDDGEDAPLEDEAVPFEGEGTVDGVKIRVEADAGAFPAGATLSVKRVPSYKQKLVSDAIDEVRDADRQVAVSYTFDVKVLDANGVEIQPAEGYFVRVSFALAEVADANLETDVYHVTGEGSDLSAEPLETLESGETVMADSEGFSYYTVEFTYDTKQYVLAGGESVALDAILNAVGLEGTVTEVQVSNPDLFSASEESGAWMVTSHVPFTTEEWMKVTVDDVTYDIVVTDDAPTEVSTWVDLYNAMGAGGDIILGDHITFTSDNPFPLLVPSNTTVTLDLNGKKIDRGLTGKEAVDNGNVITVVGNLTVKGNGTITGGNNAPSIGEGAGGVYVNVGGTFTMEGGTISGNSTTKSGGGVYIESSGTFTMNGGTISGNSAVNNGGGLSIGSGAGLSVSGAVNISGNYKGDNENNKNNVYLPASKTISVTSALGANAEIGVTSATTSYPVVITGTLPSSDDASKFSSDNTAYSVIYSDNVAKMGAFHIHEDGLTFDNAIASASDIPASSASGNYFLTDNITLANTWEINGDIALCLNGNTINLNNKYINIGSAGSFTLYDCDSDSLGSITGYTGINSPVNVKGAFTLKSGKITGNNNTGKGGGVYVNGGTFTMDGGAISQNNVMRGGGVYVYDGTFTMNDGTISGNTSTDIGGGVCVYKDNNNPCFIMNSGEIAENHSKNSGGGVEVYGGSFTMNDGEISRNYTESSTSKGGGVCVDGGTFTMNGGNITRNGLTGETIKTKYGGGVAVVNSGTFTAQNNTDKLIRSNQASAGGGVYLEQGTFTMNASTTIDNNTANGSGGGVYLCSSSTVSMTDSKITSNIATTGSGGGVYILNGSFTMSGGTITGNTADNGGGVGVDDTFKISGKINISSNLDNADNNSNVYLRSNSDRITINGQLTNTERIGVAKYGNSGQFTNDFGKHHGTIDDVKASKYFISDKTGYGVFADGDSEAKLSPANTITYHLNEGAFIEGYTEPTQFPSNTSIDLPTKDNVVRTGYAFVGWYNNEACTGEALTQTSGYNNLELWAKWLRYLTNNATVTIADLTYNGIDQTPDITVKDGTTTLTKDTDYTVSYAPTGTDGQGSDTVKDAGNYTAQITFKGNYIGTQNEPFTVAQKDLTNTDSVTIDALTYNGNDQTPNITVMDGTTTLAEGTDYTVTYAPTGTDGQESNTVKNAGGYTAKIEFAGNYTGTTSMSFDVGKATLTITPKSGQSKTYGENDPTLEYEAPTGLLDNDNVSIITGALSRATGNDVGEYEITQGTLSAGDNYTINVTSGVKFAITPLEVTLNWENTTLSYNGEAQSPTVMIGNLIEGDDCQAIVSDDSKKIDVGEYSATATLTGAKASNYKLPESASHPFEITKVTLTITPTANQSKIYGEADPTLNYTPSGLKGSDAISGALSRKTGNDAGTYAIEQGALTVVRGGTSVANNYDIVVKDEVFTIKPKEVTPTVNVDAGDIIYDGAAKTPATVTVMDGETEIPAEEYTVSYTDNVNAGTDTAKVTITDNADGNYTVNEVSATFSIAKRPATVTANGQSVPLNGSIDKAVGQVTLNNGAPGHSVGEVTLTATSDTESVGSFPGAIVPSAAKIVSGGVDVTENYEISYANGDLTVRKVDVSVTAPKAVSGLVYDGSAKALVAAGTTSGGTMQYSLSKDGPFTDAIPTGANAGGYNVYYRVKGDDRYNDSAVLGPISASIAKKALTVSAEDKTKPYGGDDPELTYTVSGLLGDDELTGALARESGEDPGKYAIGQGTLTASDNYAIDFTGATLTILDPPQPEPNYTLLATMMSTSGTKTLDLTWTRVSGADGYDIFFTRCTGKSVCKLLASVKGRDNCDYTIKKLINGVDYKGYVRAWKMVDGVKSYIGNASPTVHAICGRSTKKLCDAGRITLKKSSFTLIPGSTATIKGSVKGSKYGKPVLRHAKALRYFTSDANIADVSASGVITAVGEGSCEIYVMANNGIYRTVKVTVESDPVSVSFKKGVKTVKVGRTLNLAKRVSLVPAMVQTGLTWTSSRPNVATVSETGVVRAVSKGKTVIFVGTDNGKIASITITVK